MHIRSTKGPIDVYLCEVEQSRPAAGARPACPEKGDGGLVFRRCRTWCESVGAWRGLGTPCFLSAGVVDTAVTLAMVRPTVNT